MATGCCMCHRFMKKEPLLRLTVTDYIYFLNSSDMVDWAPAVISALNMERPSHSPPVMFGIQHLMRLQLRVLCISGVISVRFKVFRVTGVRRGVTSYFFHHAIRHRGLSPQDAQMSGLIAAPIMQKPQEWHVFLDDRVLASKARFRLTNSCLRPSSALQ